MMKLYQHGDLAGIPKAGILPWLGQKVFYPHTELFHWVLICDYIVDEKDYVILEATPGGFKVGRLSWYSHYRVFRPVNHGFLGRLACQKLTAYGRSKYDYRFIASLPFVVLFCWMKQLFTTGRCRAIRAHELPYVADERLCCTEAVVLAWQRVGVWLVPSKTKPIPAALMEAVEKGVLEEIK
jgi:hypothetical protein